VHHNLSVCFSNSYILQTGITAVSQCKCFSRHPEVTLVAASVKCKGRLSRHRCSHWSSTLCRPVDGSSYELCSYNTIQYNNG